MERRETARKTPAETGTVDAPTAPPRILVVDDDLVLLDAVAELLSAEGYEVTTAGSAEEALDRCRADTFHLVLCDYQLPGRNGLSLVKTLREACPSTALVLITGHGSIRSAVSALKRGADEYLTKPVKPRRLIALCAELTTGRPSYLPNRLLDRDGADVARLGRMVARSTAMRQVFERIELAARAGTTVLVTGESGTGKELVAHAIHHRSPRAAGPFIALHTGALPRELIASELFGHEKGAFTGAVERSAGKFELAEGGTLFLDEISTMDEQTQVNLLRVMETFRYTRVGGQRERVADVRVVAASNRDLGEMVDLGEFRADLLYRLNIFAIHLPPLRERPEDIPVLATEILAELSQRYGREPLSVPVETQRLLAGYSWPGNVRELRNVIEQSMLLARGSVLEPKLLPQMLHQKPRPSETMQIQIGSTMESIEREVILRTLAAHAGNKTAAAEALGISRRSIYNKLAAYGESGGNEVPGD